MATSKTTNTQNFGGRSYSLRTSNGERYSDNGRNITRSRRLNIAGDTLSSVATYTSAGAAIGQFGGPIGAGVGAALGAALGLGFGWFFSDKKRKEEDRAIRDSLINKRDAEQNNRNIAIKNAKDSISLTRSSIDNTYGTGTFNDFNALFSEIFNVPANSSTLMSFLSNMEYDTVGGKIATSSLDANVVQGGDMSLGDIKENYLNYFKQQLGASNSAFGIQMRQYDAEENNLLSTYSQNAESLQMQVAKSFSDAFLQRQQEQAQGDMAMAQASLKQATSGLRQTAGSGQNLTNLQKFQNDLADIAYASLMDYTIKSYEASAKGAMQSMQYQMNSIRAEKNKSYTNALASIINTYNSQRSESSKAKVSIDSSEEFITETNEEIIDYSQSVGYSKKDNSDLTVIY